MSERPPEFPIVGDNTDLEAPALDSTPKNPEEAEAQMRLAVDNFYNTIIAAHALRQQITERIPELEPNSQKDLLSSLDAVIMFATEGMRAASQASGYSRELPDFTQSNQELVE